MSTPTQPPGVDAAAPARLVRQGGDPLLAALVDLFLDGAPARFERGRGCLAAGDSTGLAGLAHGWKVSCRMLGIDSMAELCIRLEAEAERGRLEHVGEILGALEADFQRVRPWLVAQRPPGGTPP